MTDEQITGIDCSWFSDCIYFKQLCKLKLKVDGIRQENERLKAELKTYDKAQYEEFKRAEQYRQTLQEIKDIAEKLVIVARDNFPYNRDKETWGENLAKQILDKIAEVM